MTRTLDLGRASAGPAPLYVPIGDVPGVRRLPFVLRVLLENLLRQQRVMGLDVSDAVAALLERRIGAALPFRPSRIYGQDILAKVMLVDMAGLRDALASAGMDPRVVNPAVPIDIVIDHSLQVDAWARPEAARINLATEYARNAERFAFLRWCAEHFDRVRVTPPGKGIMHQIHLEKIARVVWSEAVGDDVLLSPDTCVGVDSHTPMINGLGVLGWGVGGLEAEAVMLGKAISIALPPVTGVEVTGRLPDGVMPTDLALTMTERLRRAGVVGHFVEFFGSGVETLTTPDRATIANMAPEYGATVVYFPIDLRALDYLRMTARAPDHVALVAAYARAQALWRDPGTPAPAYDRIIAVDLGDIRPSLAGPRKPESRFDLSSAASAFAEHRRAWPERSAPEPGPRAAGEMRDGDVVIAAIASCTNTSSPTGMIAAGLLARNAVRRGLTRRPWVKTSFTPGSHVVAEVLVQSGLQGALDALGFHVAGFGCATCNGGSGPLSPEIAQALDAQGVVATAVLSGNRNFQGRIHPQVKAAYLASPALVVAYAIAGSMTVDVTRQPLGRDPQGAPVFLAELWPSSAEIEALVGSGYRSEIFAARYADLFEGGPEWDRLRAHPPADAATALFPWREDSAYLRRPPYFDDLPVRPATTVDIRGARALVILGDSVTTDDISPSGTIDPASPSADYLKALGVAVADFNAYTTRRGHHEVAMRATFANIRLRNRMTPDVEGPFTRLAPEGERMRIFDAAQVYRARGTPLAVIAGRDYGCGSSRDWAAKGPALLGVKAVIAESFERIHRSNLVGMGVIPLQFPEGVSAASLGLDGSEAFDILGLEAGFPVGGEARLRITRPDGGIVETPLTIRLDTPEDILYWRHGGVLPLVWREYMTGAPAGEEIP